MGFFRKVLSGSGIFFGLVFGADLFAKDGEFNGSAHLSLGERFFKDERLGNKNSFKDGFIPEFSIDFGVYEFPFRLEPMVGISYVMNTAHDCGVDASGNCIGARSTDKLKYHLLGLSTGMRWTAWREEFFKVIPFVAAAISYHYIHIRRITASTSAKKTINGGDFGGDIQVGLLMTFIYSDTTRKEIFRDWGAKDFGLSLFGRYQPFGLFKHGMAEILSTGGYGFGAGLYVDW